VPGAKPGRAGDHKPSVVLEFDDLGEVDVGAVLSEPERYVGETLADPIEGVAYGRNCGIVQERDGAISIFSFAHGGRAIGCGMIPTPSRLRSSPLPRPKHRMFWLGWPSAPTSPPAEEAELAKLAGSRFGGMRATHKMLSASVNMPNHLVRSEMTR
jgi:hypothetical protein